MQFMNIGEDCIHYTRRSYCNGIPERQYRPARKYRHSLLLVNDASCILQSAARNTNVFFFTKIVSIYI